MDIDVINRLGRKGEKYVLFLTDDYSGYRVGFPIASRSGQIVLDSLMGVLPYLERQTGNTLKCIRSDNALEFCKGVFPEKMKQLGIEQEFTVPYEHEQAGMAESTNRIIVDKARTMLLACGLGIEYWPDAVRTALFVANRSWHYGSKGIYTIHKIH